jgi:FkbH-like protein
MADPDLVHFDVPAVDGHTTAMRELEYPFDAGYLLKKSKRIKRTLLEQTAADGTPVTFLKKRIAVLGGSTTHDIIRMLELFLLNYGIEPEFYESEYAQYWQDAMFDNEELVQFHPDLIYIHTTGRNITFFPDMEDSLQGIEDKLEAQMNHFRVMWEKLENTYHCPVIQNNFEFPFYRILGNRDSYDPHGKTAFIQRLNMEFARYAAQQEHFYIYDIQYESAAFGLDRWTDPSYWHMYKYAMSMQAIPDFAFHLSHIIKAVFGKNKKAFVLDLDNTLWGGIVGDDGPENLEIGQETSMGQVYQEFQGYLKEHKKIGVLLNVDSKNEEENALAGLKHPEGILKPEDFIVIKANWLPKSQNLTEIASELNIGRDALVFVDDNPAEREIIRQHVPETAVPEMTDGDQVNPDQFIRILDKNAYFEVVTLSEDDKHRNEMYKANAMRKEQEESFGNYSDFLKSLEMEAVIRGFEPVYYSRIAQLTNKSNQFNLTTKRMTQAEVEQMAQDPGYITLYGKLKDKFGDNGVVSLVIGKKNGDTLELILWLMSCRVLKRDMEQAMLDTLVWQSRESGIRKLHGYYYKTAKNAMVKDFYGAMGFQKLSEKDGDSEWEYVIPEKYENKNLVIDVNC